MATTLHLEGNQLSRLETVIDTPTRDGATTQAIEDVFEVLGLSTDYERSRALFASESPIVLPRLDISVVSNSSSGEQL